MNLGRTELASATEISLTLAWVSMVVLHHSQLHPDAAAFEQARGCAWLESQGLGWGNGSIDVTLIVNKPSKTSGVSIRNLSSVQVRVPEHVHTQTHLDRRSKA